MSNCEDITFIKCKEIEPGTFSGKADDLLRELLRVYPHIILVFDMQRQHVWGGVGT